MTWGTDFKTDIFISRQSFESKGDIDMKLEELDKTIEDIKAQIKMYSSATPKDIMPEDWKEEPINWLSTRLDELFENYEERVIEMFKISMYLDYVLENNIDLSKKITAGDLPI